MAEARPNMMTEDRNTQGEREERIVDILVSPESLRDQHQDHVGTEESSMSLRTGRSQRPDAVSPPRCPIRAVVVLLGLLSVVLLAGLLGLAVQYKTVMEKTVSMDRDMEKTIKEKTTMEKTIMEKTIMEKTVSMERDMEQLLQRLKNVTEQRDALLCQQSCPISWNKFGCKCYRLSDVYGSWNKSRKFCVSQGADLVVVDSKEEMDFISRNVSSFWLGATDEAREGMWRWVDGTVLSVDNPSWSRGKPDGGEDKNCLMLKVSEETKYKWRGERCEVQRKGICERDLVK
ncbi:unnamed protein product [Lota lota]